MTDFPSSLMARQPFSAIPLMSASSSPFWPLVTAPSWMTFVRDSLLALSMTSRTFTPLSMTGFVLGMAHTVVTPPRTAARPPVARVSLYSSPGSRKCTCRSIKPGITQHPSASMTRSLSVSIFFSTSVIRSPSIRTSHISSSPVPGSSTCPFLIKIVIACIPFYIHTLLYFIIPI